MNKLIKFNDRLIEMVEELKLEKGYPSFSAVVVASIIDLHTKTFPSYARSPKKNETPEEQVNRLEEGKKARINQLRKAQLEIAEKLGGTVSTETGGNEVCTYYTYTGKKRYQNKVSLSQLSPDLLNTQYSPSREVVEKLQKEGKTENY